MKETKNFARWKWVIVAFLGLLLWQVIMNSQFIAVKGMTALGILEQYATWVPAIMAVIAIVISLIGFQLLYLWPGGGLAGLGFTAQSFKRDFLIGLAVAAFQAGVSLFVIIPLLGEHAETLLSSVSGLFRSPEVLIASIVLVVIYGGFVEEIFFRGHVMTSVGNALGGRQWSFAIALMLSMALFGISHDYQGTIGMAYSAAAAAVWGGLFLVTRRLTASITAHAIYDLLTLLGIYFIYPQYVLG